jgi:hypothetical protein
LKLAKDIGTDIVINTKEKDLKEVSSLAYYLILFSKLWEACKLTNLIVCLRNKRKTTTTTTKTRKIFVNPGTCKIKMAIMSEQLLYTFLNTMGRLWLNKIVNKTFI